MYVTLLCIIAVGVYIVFFQNFHPHNHFIMTHLPFYQNMKLVPTPTFHYLIDDASVFYHFL